MNDNIIYDQLNNEYQENDDWSFPECKYVSGFSESQILIQPTNDIRENYSNLQIDGYLEGYFRFFGKKDMDIVYLYFISKKKQQQIVQILGKTQPAVSYDVTRIKEQMQFVIKLISSIDDFIMFITNPDNNLKVYDKQMLTLFFYTTSITKTAVLMNINTVSCRSHLNTIVNRLLANGEVQMYNLFKFILSNLNKTKKYVEK